jgi:hypothetical protein
MDETRPFALGSGCASHAGTTPARRASSAATPQALRLITEDPIQEKAALAASLLPAPAGLLRVPYAARHGVNRGIQRGTLARKVS